jgi:hypothetical protein
MRRATYRARARKVKRDAYERRRAKEARRLRLVTSAIVLCEHDLVKIDQHGAVTCLQCGYDYGGGRWFGKFA